MKHRRSGFFLAVLLFWSSLAALLPIGTATARTEPQKAVENGICHAAAAAAAAESGVPRSVLTAIAFTESGRRTGGAFLPWPWTVNMEGKGLFFETPDAALSYVRTEMTRGAVSFDLGCFQINFRWHGQHFQSLEDMIDPVESAQYAARFLTTLFLEFGSWEKAAAAYHSRTPKYANRYKRRFSDYRNDLLHLDAADGPPVALARIPQEQKKRPNRYPLLRRGGVQTPGSLVPSQPDGALALIALDRPRGPMW
ncbi:MAG: transglycosylase SLT domain-containing protein [Pseudomonadota bacterium]